MPSSSPMNPPNQTRVEEVSNVSQLSVSTRADSLPATPAYKTALLGALFTVLTLFGGMLAGVAIGLVFQNLPGHSLPSALSITLGVIPAILGLVAGGAAWGVAMMGRLARAKDLRRMALAGSLGFAPVTILLAIGLLTLEPIAVEKFGAQLPIHRVFTLFFVPAAFIIAGVSAFAMGRGLNDRALAVMLLWRVGLAAALAFLAVNLAMEAAGWIVGAPGAAERATMLVVMFVGNLGAALAGGAVMGSTLASALRSGSSVVD